MLHLGPAREHDPPVMRSTATLGEGIDEIWQAIEEHQAWTEASGARDARRRARLLAEVESLAAERFRMAVMSALEADEGLAADLAERRVDPYGAAAALARRASP
jgi:LAO/AO transport system kinase